MVPPRMLPVAVASIDSGVMLCGVRSYMQEEEAVCKYELHRAQSLLPALVTVSVREGSHLFGHICRCSVSADWPNQSVSVTPIPLY